MIETGHYASGRRGADTPKRMDAHSRNECKRLLGDKAEVRDAVVKRWSATMEPPAKQSLNYESRQGDPALDLHLYVKQKA